MQKFANSIFTSVAYHDRMITMFGPLNHFSIEAAGLDPEGLKTVVVVWGGGGGVDIDCRRHVSSGVSRERGRV